MFLRSFRFEILNYFDKASHGFQHAFRSLEGQIRRFPKDFRDIGKAFQHHFHPKHPKIAKKMEENRQNVPFGNPKTSDFSRQNIRTFGTKPPYFVSKKSVLFVFPPEKRRKTGISMGEIFGSQPMHAGRRGRFQPIKHALFLKFH